MDETRDRAYLELIHTLLNCPNGSQPQILQDNLELLDRGFLATCEVIAETMAQQGGQNGANYLRNLATQLAKYIDDPIDRPNGDNSAGDNFQEYANFILELLQAEQDSNSDIKVIYPMLAGWQHLLNSCFAQTLQQLAQNLIADKNPQTIESIIALIGNLSIHIYQFPLGSRANNIQIAITGYQIILNNLEPGSENFAQTQYNLANAYSNRINGSRADNLERAIEFYQAALTVYTCKDFPEKWAGTQNNLGEAYSNRINGSRADNLERAIEFYRDALTVYTCKDLPEEWAGTQNNLALAYSNRINGSRVENLERAIGFFEAALTVYTLEDFPEKWAMTQNNLAIAYSDRINDRINGSRAENLERAIEFFEAALTVRTFDGFPEKWAMTQNNLAAAYTNRINGSRAENLEQAIDFYQAALTVYTLEDFPEKWAGTQNNLAIAYTNRINGLRTDNLELAIASYHNALTISTREAFPQNHTESLSNLGTLYRSNQQCQLAYDTYIPAIETVEFIRGEIQSGDESKQKLAEEWNKLYLGMVEVCIELQRYTEAIEYAERSKGQNLIELLSVKDLYPKGEIPSEVRQELQQLRRRIAEENQRLKQAEEKNYDTINQLRQDLTAKYPYTPLKFGEIQQLAGEKAAIVEWYILGDSFCAFSITKNNSQPQFLSFTDESDLKRLTDWANEYLGDYYSNPQQWQNSLETKLANLAQILHIDEILAAIPETCDKLILIPHRYLHLFPIHALPISREIWQRFHRENENYPLNPCLVDCFDKGVSYAPSCQILHQVQKYKRGKFDKLFAIQNPKDDLMAADIAVETIKKLFSNPEILAKQYATKGKELEGKLEIAERVTDSHHLFFACHGSFDRNDPLQSGLQLADGTLTLEEIIRYFNLSECSLVTLSACETGQIQLDNTDEYISLTSGFLLAGSPSLYVSLWSVNALSTAILLIKTYENLYHQPGKLALSLNQAQIWMRDTDIQGFLDWTNQCHLLDTNQDGRKKLQRNLNRELRIQGGNAKIYQNPYHWAGFCTVGKGEQGMANSNTIIKLEIFQQIIQKSGLFINLTDDLLSLKYQLTNNDETNVKIIENWIEELPENDKENILGEYEHYLLNVEMLGRDGKSSTKPGGQSEILKEVLENAIPPKEKPPEPKKDA